MSDSDSGKWSGQPTQFGYWDNDNWVDITDQQLITPENLSFAYKKMFGTEAPQEWIEKTQGAYDPNTNMLNHVMYNTALGKASDSTPFANASGDQGGFTSGADYYLKQGYTPSGQTYEGVPTQFIDPKTGKVVASYGILQEAGGNPKSTASNAWRWNETANTPQGYETSLAIPRTDWNSAFREGVLGSIMATAPVWGGMGLEALGALEGLGAGLGGGVEAFPVSLGDSITMSPLGEAVGGWEGSSAIMDSIAQGLPPLTEAEMASLASTAGIPLSEAAKYAQYGLKGLGALQSIAGMGGGQGLRFLQGGQGGQGGQSGQGGYGGTTMVVNPTGPWNTFLKPGLETVGQANQRPITTGLENLEMLSDTMPSQSYFTYGSPVQTASLPAYRAGGGVLSQYKDGGETHVPEFITGATGHYVKGRGDGQSDDIPAMLADGEYVFDSSAVSTLGNGSSDAGAKLLDAFRESLREHTRSAPKDEIPPKASPLEYMKTAMKKVGIK